MGHSRQAVRAEVKLAPEKQRCENTRKFRDKPQASDVIPGSKQELGRPVI